MKKVDKITKTQGYGQRKYTYFVLTRIWNPIDFQGHRSKVRSPEDSEMPLDSKMPEYCQVRNFETYLEKRHRQCNRLWQLPMNVGSKAQIMAADTNLPRQLPQPQGIYILSRECHIIYHLTI